MKPWKIRYKGDILFLDAYRKKTLNFINIIFQFKWVFYTCFENFTLKYCINYPTFFYVKHFQFMELLYIEKQLIHCCKYIQVFTKTVFRHIKMQFTIPALLLPWVTATYSFFFNIFIHIYIYLESEFLIYLLKRYIFLKISWFSTYKQ